MDSCWLLLLETDGKIADASKELLIIGNILKSMALQQQVWKAKQSAQPQDDGSSKILEAEKVEIPHYALIQAVVPMENITQLHNDISPTKEQDAPWVLDIISLLQPKVPVYKYTITNGDCSST
ncbi:hypothetical protein ACH5RR_026183 [Cinchona calisaya]|uniref:Uncharacterized protein n=1 Tax=Cinchona calisaya TaxID=153742 RepID=A0ABD2Z237_9GENT